MQNFENVDEHLAGILQMKMEEEFKDYSNIYVDIECLLDLKLTALLSICTEEEYHTILPHVANYNVDVATERFLTLLDMTPHNIETIQAIIKKPTDVDRYTYMMQGKTTLNRIIDILRENVQHLNKNTGSVTVGCGNKFIPDGVQHVIRKTLNVSGQIQVRFVKQTLEELSEYDMLTHSMFFIYDIEHTHAANHKIQLILGEGKFFGKLVFSHPMLSISEEQLRKDNPNVTDPMFFDSKAILQRQAELFSTLCEFNYLPMGLENV